MLMQPPGANRDLSGPQQQLWTGYVSEVFRGAIDDGTSHGQKPWFVDATALPEAPPAVKDIDWTAFPKRQPGKHAAVDRVRQAQDEYCEWAVTHTDGELTEVTFTTETYDYFNFLNIHAEDTLKTLYRHYVSPDVELSDLRDPTGKYNPRNDWNTGVGAPGRLMHMAQTDNTFGAAAVLSSQAAWPAVEGGNGAEVPVVSEQELIACLNFGVASRHSDPHIGAQVNEVVRGGSKVALADPVGLYIHRIFLDAFETPDGSSITDWLEYDDDRGVDGFRTRVTFRAPHGSDFTLQDLTVDARQLTTGGQIAEKIRVRIRGWAVPTDEPALEPHVCGGPRLEAVARVVHNRAFHAEDLPTL